MKKFLISICVALSIPALSQELSQTQDVAASATNTSIFTKKQQLDQEGIELYRTNLEMKAFKRIGLGAATGGLIGGIGLHAEFNLVPSDALVLGLGRGEAYNSFHFAWKHNFESEYLSAYTKVGYGKWFNNGSGGGSAQSNDVLRRVLTDAEIRDNKFGTDFLAGGAGLEYNQLEGDLSGLNFFGELLMLTEVKRSIFLPTGSVGITYFY